MLIDLHNHTRGLSWDSELTPDDLIDAAKKAGLDGICLTEHDFFWDHEAVRELARRHSFVVIPGVEVNTEDGHVLCFGLEKYVYGMHRWPELAGHVEAAGGAMIAAHPYRRRMPWHPEKPEDYAQALQKAIDDPFFTACTAIERTNGRGTAQENRFSMDLAERLGLPVTAASDSHRLGDVARYATEFLNRVETLEDLMTELRAGRMRPMVLTPDPSLTAPETPAYSALPSRPVLRRAADDVKGTNGMSEDTESLITAELRDSIGKDAPAVIHEVDKTSIRMFARAVGHTDPSFYDEAYAISKGHRSLVAPPGYLGTPIFDPNAPYSGPGSADASGRVLRVLNGGSEFEYTGTEICAGDTLRAVTRVIDINERRSSLGLMMIMRRQTTYSNQEGEVVCRTLDTRLMY